MHLILGKAAKFLVEKVTTSEVISQKPHGGGAFRVKATAILMKKSISKKDMQLYFYLQRCPFIRSRWQSTSDEDVSIEVKSLFSSKGDKIIIKFPLG